MAHAGNDDLIIFQFSYNIFNLYFRIGCYHSNLLYGTTQVITSILFALLRLRAINNGKRETVRIQLHERPSAFRDKGDIQRSHRCIAKGIRSLRASHARAKWTTAAPHESLGDP